MCDTFVAMPAATADGSVIFGKNSDREPNEAQCLEYHPARRYPAGQSVRCTYREIPQVRETHPVLLCRPFWMWGAEIGANEQGVAIGNQAVFTKMPYRRSGGLTGMDLLRLALERAASAEAALEVMVQLLADYGQGGLCGYEDRRFVYHNSFLIADPAQAWVLETADALWAAKQVRDFYAISNGLTIGAEFDRAHPALIKTARRKGWLKKGEDFHFARCYSDRVYTTFSAARQRRRQAESLLRQRSGHIDAGAAMTHLRDHGAAGFRPDRDWLSQRICAHAGNPLTRHATQTTGSLIAHLKKERHTVWVTGTAGPCTAVFKPVWFHGAVLPDTGPPPGKRFDPAALWWRHESLHRAVLVDFETRLTAFQEERDALEQSIRDAAAAPGSDLFSRTENAFRQAEIRTATWVQRVQTVPVRKKPALLYRQYWQRQNKKAGFRMG